MIVPDLHTALDHHFGFAAFRAGQHDALDATLSARDALVVMPTGSGKSLCFQLSALLLADTTLVISPLVALMKDQVDALVARGKRATYINSTLSAEEQQNKLNILARGWYKIVYVAPERLRNAAFLDALKHTRVALLAVDEAHCISQWGHDFRPDYLRLREFADALNRPPMIALTATATPQVQTDIIAQLGLRAPIKIVTGFNRPNLALRVRYTPDDDAKRRELAALLREHTGSAIIYAGTRRGTEEISAFCGEVTRAPAAFYHAGMADDERTRVQDAFMRDKIKIIVATNAFGMGVDKPDIRAVIHYAIPSTVEAYYQEIGRAGRDGEPARVVLLYSPKDRELQEWFIENDAPEPRQVAHLYQILQRAKNWVSPGYLQRATNLNDSKLQLALRQLELAGALKRLGDARGLIGVEVTPNVTLNLAESEAETEKRRAHRRKLLAQIIAYAETNQCRRQFILRYFGDAGNADAPDCCDNHRAATTAPTRRAESAEEWVPLVILETARTLQRQVGTQKLAQILHGSHAQEILQFGYTRHKFYGKLADYRVGEIENVIEQLLKQGYLKTIGGKYPVAQITPLGEETVNTRAAIAIELPRAPSPTARAETHHTRQAGGTVARTLALVQQGKLPAEIAQERDLAISTIYGHLEQLVTEGKVLADQLVPADVREQICAGMREWNGQWLSDLKARLPAAITYEQIRLVVAAEKKK
ncbi:MAG: RecQ family ATP-dependent DNA helicase [Chloroflexi bacterium]|nr:RecQ family ATP-dependent DNA helicase [Chloroflexota bacterium]